MKKFKKVKTVKNKKLFLKNRYKNNNDFVTKPNVGGTPAKEKITIINVIAKNGIFPIFLKSFKVLKYIVLNVNNIVNRVKFKYK